MKYKVLHQIALPGKTRYTVDLELDDGEVLPKERLFKALDAPFGAPFGGHVHHHRSDGFFDIDIYTE